ncbi:MAG: hypothetical protein QW212_00540 [Nitrososphaerales archaeon]
MTFNVASAGDKKTVEIWLGSTDTQYKLVPLPPATTIQLSVVDLDPAQHNWNAQNGPWWKIVQDLSQESTTNPLTPLTVGSQVLGGVNNAFHFYLILYEPQQNPGYYTDWVLTTNDVQVVPI